MKKLFYLFAVLLLVSCSEEPKTETVEIEKVSLASLGELVPTDGVVAEDLMEYGSPFKGQRLNDSTFVFQGDILIDASMQSEPLESGQKVLPGKGATRTKGFWPDNKFYYQIDPSLDPIIINRIREAVDTWRKLTHIEFIEGMDSDGSHAEFVYSGGGCYSYIGKVGFRAQPIGVGFSCSVGSIMHEIAHALGVWHEQTRSDRDQHLNVNWGNIRSGYEHNFETYLEQGWDGQDIGEFDFNSIMLYPSWAFAKDYSEPTLTKLDGSSYSVNRSAPSQGDINTINAIYPEDESEPVYVNGQFYYIAGLTVLRFYDRWYFKTKYGYKRVELRNGRWYWL